MLFYRFDGICYLSVMSYIQDLYINALRAVVHVIKTTQLHKYIFGLAFL
jgi:hypothetical protein